MDTAADIVAKPQELQPEVQKLSSSPTSSPSKQAVSEEPSLFSMEDSQHEEDLLKEFNKKHSELSTFLQDIPPSDSVVKDQGMVSSQEAGIPKADFSTLENIISQPANLMEEDDPFGLNLSNSSGQNETLPKPAEIIYGKVNGKTDGESGDAKLLQDLLDQANSFGGDVSPDSLLTEDLLGLDKSPAKSSLKDQVVPPAMSHNEDILSVQKFATGSPNLMESDLMLDRSSVSPMELEEPKLPDTPCFKPPSPIATTTDARELSPKLPDSPCFKSPSPEVTSVQERPLIVDRPSVEPNICAMSEPEVMVCPGKPSPSAPIETFIIAGDVEEDYTRRETKTFDNETELVQAKFIEEVKKSPQHEFGGGDLPPSHNILDHEAEIPPPIPKHSWEIEKETPPPVPPHSITSNISPVLQPFFLYILICIIRYRSGVNCFQTYLTPVSLCL